MPDVIAMRRKRVSYIQPRLICVFLVWFKGVLRFLGVRNLSQEERSSIRQSFGRETKQTFEDRSHAVDEGVTS